MPTEVASRLVYIAESFTYVDEPTFHQVHLLCEFHSKFNTENDSIFSCIAQKIKRPKINHFI